jgi:hypothetical protein
MASGAIMSPVTRSWYPTPVGWRHVDAHVGVGEAPGIHNDGVRAVELVFLAFVALGTTFAIAHAALDGHRHH